MRFVPYFCNNFFFSLCLFVRTFRLLHHRVIVVSFSYNFVCVFASSASSLLLLVLSGQKWRKNNFCHPSQRPFILMICFHSNAFRIHDDDDGPYIAILTHPPYRQFIPMTLDIFMTTRTFCAAFPSTRDTLRHLDKVLLFVFLLLY